MLCGRLCRLSVFSGLRYDSPSHVLPDWRLLEESLKIRRKNVSIGIADQQTQTHEQKHEEEHEHEQNASASASAKSSSTRRRRSKRSGSKDSLGRRRTESHDARPQQQLPALLSWTWSWKEMILFGAVVVGVAAIAMGRRERRY